MVSVVKVIRSGTSYSYGYMNGPSNIENTGLLTVRRALKLMEWIAAQRNDPTVREAATKLGFNTTTGYHLVNTLMASGYLIKGEDRRLQLGPKVPALHHAFLRRHQSSRLFLPLLQDLSRRTEETAYLSTWNQGDVVLQAVVEGSATLRVAGLYVGLRGAAYCRASGKAILAHLPVAERTAYLDKAPFRPRTPHTVTGRQPLQEILARVRARGYAVDEQEFEIGVCCLAAPYFDAEDRVAGAITVSMPSSRFRASRELLCRLTCEVARRASLLLGHRGPRVVHLPRN